MSLDAPHTVKEIVDLDTTLAAYVLKTALEGHENDQFATYDNALFGAPISPAISAYSRGRRNPQTTRMPSAHRISRRAVA